MKKTSLKNIYKFDEKTRSYFIEIALDYYQELFNDWDAAPIRKKDLDPELITYIESSSDDIPNKSKIQFIITLPLQQKDLIREKKAIEGIRNYFTATLYFINQDLGKIIRKIITFIVLGLFFISTAYFLKQHNPLLLGFDVLVEGIFIGGWVLLWEAFSLFFFENYSILKRKKMYQRFNTAPITFKYLHS